ncbi:MAG: Filamentous hemagglutinin [candidate division WS2 bacterium]|nr:Filamentous hemagglutinin [Candidatus Lithacetigena glycinireducens]
MPSNPEGTLPGWERVGPNIYRSTQPQFARYNIGLGRGKKTPEVKLRALEQSIRGIHPNYQPLPPPTSTPSPPSPTPPTLPPLSPTPKTRTPTPTTPTATPAPIPHPLTRPSPTPSPTTPLPTPTQTPTTTPKTRTPTPTPATTPAPAPATTPTQPAGLPPYTPPRFRRPRGDYIPPTVFPFPIGTQPQPTPFPERRIELPQLPQHPLMSPITAIPYQQTEEIGRTAGPPVAGMPRISPTGRIGQEEADTIFPRQEQEEVLRRLISEFSPDATTKEYKQLWEQHRPELEKIEEDEKKKLKQYLAQIGGLEGTGVESMTKLLVDQGRRSAQLRAQLLVQARERGITGMERLFEKLEGQRQARQQASLQQFQLKQNELFKEHDTKFQETVRQFEADTQAKLFDLERNWQQVMTYDQYRQQRNILETELRNRTALASFQLNWDKERTQMEMQRDYQLRAFDNQSQVSLAQAQMIHQKDMLNFEKQWRDKLTTEEYIFQVGLKNQEFIQRTNEINQQIAFEKKRWQAQFNSEWTQRERAAQINIAMANAAMQQQAITAAQQAALGAFLPPV